MVSNGELVTQLAQANENLETLRVSVDAVERRARTSKRLTYSVIFVVVLVILLGTLGFFIQRDRARELDDLTRDLFVTNCEAANATRQEIRDSNIAQAEAILEVAGTDERDPELAETYRQAVREANEIIVSRDCGAEVELADSTEGRP